MPYTRYFLFAAALPLLVVMALGWYVQPLSGDLTRLGHLPERDFGWRAPQARVPVAPHDPQAKPVVAVLGDSFSERNIWQSMAMAQAGVPFVSFDWKGVGGAACVGPWMAAVHAAYPTVRVVVVETVERMFVKRFAAADDTCLALAPLQALHYEAGDTPASRDTEWHLALPDAVYAWRASWSSLRDFARQTHTGGAYVAPLVCSCSMKTTSSSEPGAPTTCNWRRGGFKACNQWRTPVALLGKCLSSLTNRRCTQRM